MLNEWIFSPPKVAEELLSEKLVSYFQINNSGKNCFLLYSSILNKIQALCNNEQIVPFNLKSGGLVFLINNKKILKNYLKH